ncbi:hypothetical protein KIN20_001470 [Parelaphostrongylus tenuis]|uniref:Uncharacterized protein n=1 Tax=Parelaphostrongylus tenuis TaxID=148309 RepID=A0AAD5LX15_PARTN|nr:hypothetical protein KIN20_001470 [Parelaphostrongylus tenuis]
MREQRRRFVHLRFTKNLFGKILDRQQTTTTILQDTGHHYPPLFAIDPPGFGSARRTTPSALNQRTLDMLLQLHQKIQIGDLPKSVALIGKGRNQMEQCPDYKVFISSELDQYENELNVLCSFQACYLQCMIPIVEEVCVSGLSARTIELVRSFIHWHATDIADWHAVAGYFDELPESCRKIAGAGIQPDPVLQLINRA